MLKSILKENGVQEIKKNEQKSINGGVLSTNCDDIQGCQYGGYWTPTFRNGIVLICCAGTPDN
ncbi:hypothetical protein D1815_22965 [Aquimarina sp. AD1]|uniref:hypothetical protein n=1 Tax=Aquimarina TaxID=290174 RepID=UPI000405832B|nr:MULTISPECIES: hypothetical protein [Aquimarina]AXT58476.1 hypothetical protein D1815_22965 [Aquimarina sp. AD1]